MTDNKSFRIKESSPFAHTASLWQISDYFYTLQWDHWKESLTYCKEDVEDHFAKRIWTKIEEALPRSFNFKYKSSTTIYNFINENGKVTVSWDCGKSYNYTLKMAQDYIKSGDWVVLPSKPEKKSYISSISYQVNVDATEANKQLAETIALAERLEEALKSLKKVMGEDFVKIDVKGIL